LAAKQARAARTDANSAGSIDMKAISAKAVAAGLALPLAFATTAIPAEAKGCIKGAIVGGVAGHYAGHHGLLGAAAGCLIGRHAAHQHEKAMQNPSPDQVH
jgi:hypothetical protein